MMTLIAFLIGLFVGSFSIMLYLGFLTATDDLLLIFSSGKSVGNIKKLRVRTEVKKIMRQIKDFEG